MKKDLESTLLEEKFSVMQNRIDSLEEKVNKIEENIEHKIEETFHCKQNRSFAKKLVREL